MSSPYALWSVWRELHFWLKLYFLMLAFVNVYVLFSALAIMVRLRSLTNQRHVFDTSLLQHSLATLRVRAENVRQLVGATFYLFGFVFSLVLPWATVTLDNGRTPVSTLILRNVFVDIAFAANIFSVFLVLHSVQWFVSSRVNVNALHMKAQDAA